jgi:hypothetical protein
MSEWQPIETAPKDGTVIDVWLGDASASDRQFYCTGETRRAPGWAWVVDKWRPVLAEGRVLSTFVQPTHWMPLPAPPKEPDHA